MNSFIKQYQYVACDYTKPHTFIFLNITMNNWDNYYDLHELKTNNKIVKYLKEFDIIDNYNYYKDEFVIKLIQFTDHINHIDSVTTDGYTTYIFNIDIGDKIKHQYSKIYVDFEFSELINIFPHHLNQIKSCIINKSNGIYTSNNNIINMYFGNIEVMNS